MSDSPYGVCRACDAEFRLNRPWQKFCAACGPNKRSEYWRGQPPPMHRPRADRLYRGHEFQLKLDDVAIIDEVQSNRSLANRSEALRLILLWAQLHIASGRSETHTHPELGSSKGTPVGAAAGNLREG